MKDKLLVLRMRFLMTRDVIALNLGRLRSRARGPRAAGPKVSVLIPTLESRVDLLANRAVPSILAQSEQDFEVLIVTDAYSHQVKVLVDSLDARFRYLTHARIPSQLASADPTSRWCSAAAPALNLALSNARGALIARLDDDDSWFPEHLANSIHHLEAHGAEFVSSKCYLPDGSEDSDPSIDDEYYGPRPKVRHPAIPIGSPITWVYRSRLRTLRYNPWSWKKAHNRPADIDLSHRFWSAGVRLTYMERFGAQVGLRGDSEEWGLSAFLEERGSSEKKL
jgi:glycosyltransferase involved in cell wall biosynthesis